MPVYSPAINRIQAAHLTGPGCAALFEVLAEKMHQSGAVTAEFKLGYVPADTPIEDLPESGEYVPEIILRLSTL